MEMEHNECHKIALSLIANNPGYTRCLLVESRDFYLFLLKLLGCNLVFNSYSATSTRLRLLAYLLIENSRSYVE